MAEKDIDIAIFEPWMLDGMAELRAKHQRGETFDASRTIIEGQLLHDFTRDKSLIIAAINGKNIVGMQTYTYWPYVYEGREFYSVQSGLTLVDEGYRGKRIFLRMLERGHDILKEKGADFVMGFPGEMSYDGFIKDGWSHIGTPVFMIRPIRPRRLLSYRPSNEDNRVSNEDWVDKQTPRRKEKIAELVARVKYRAGSANAICLKPSHDFLKFRYGDKRGKYKVYSYGEGRQETVFICKMFFFSGFNALGIGDIHVADPSSYSLSHSLSQLIRDVRAEGNIDAIAVLIKERGYRIMRTLLRRGFLPFPTKRTPFIVKPICLDEKFTKLVKDYSKWSIMLADKDTWYLRGIYSEI